MSWDTRYEWRAVLLLGLGFGLVGLDRWIVGPLFPAMAADLNLSYQDLGNLAGILGIAWGLFAMAMGRASDRYGRRRILIPAIVIFSALSCLTGLAGGIASLLAIRAAMGAAEGAYLATSVAATGEASHPARLGLNQGLQLSSFGLLGLGVGPIVTTQLLGILPSWRYVFFAAALPGFVLAYLLWRVIREPSHLASGSVPPEPSHWSDLFRSRNVVVAMLAILCAMSCAFVLGAMLPSYLVNHLLLTPGSMGVVMSALGFGGFLGSPVVLGISDYVGRRVAALLCFAASAAATYALMGVGAEPITLFVVLFIVAFFCLGLLSLLTGPVATEAVAPAMASSAIGLVSGTGEIFGGGLAPGIAGYVAQHFGIQHVLVVAIVGLACGIVVTLFLRETAPRKKPPKSRSQVG